jgi:hypothetical protein
MAQCRFYVDAARAHCVEMAQSATFLVGSYGARPSFGSYLELKSALELHARMTPQRALLVLMTASTLQSRNDAGLGDAIIPVLFHCDDAEPSIAGHAHLVDLPRVPPSVLIHLYGGGFINDWWGRPLRTATETLVTHHMQNTVDGAARIVFTGQQVAATQELRAWRFLFERADYIGARDEESLRILGALQGVGCRVHLSGDDAMPALSATLQSRAEPGSRIAAHIDLTDYSTMAPERRLSRMAKALAAAAEHLGVGGGCDLLVSAPHPAGGGEEAVRRLVGAYTRMSAEGVAPPLAFRVRNIFEEAVNGNLKLGGSVLLSCSYHVALAGLLANTPTALLVENDDYRQKAAGLAEIFDARFRAVRAHEDLGAAIAPLIEKCEPRACNISAHRMWAGPIQKALHLSRVYSEMDTQEARQRLDHVSSAFRDTAAQLGELRKRIILQERLAREYGDSIPIHVHAPPQELPRRSAGPLTICARRLLTIPKTHLLPYLGEREKRWLRSLKRQLVRMTAP